MKRSLIILVAACALASPIRADDLEKHFAAPPAGCRPWVYWRWHWSYAELITKEGITADLEAMAAQGLGGVNLDTVGKVTPGKQAALYMSDDWLALIAHARTEATRLGLEFCIHNGDGWANSGGPWITPDNAMKELTFTATKATGPQHGSFKLPEPESHLGFYRDIAVLAFEATKTNAIPAGVINLTALMDRSGTLSWDVPAGEWSVLRIGYTATGKLNAVPSDAGSGLECDKLSPQGIEAHWRGIAPLLRVLTKNGTKLPPYIGVDSWECGAQNWTERLPEEFKARTGYDITPWLPVLAGHSAAAGGLAPRFSEDFGEQLTGMNRRNYMGRFRSLAHAEGFQTQCEAIPEAADIPMGEFWAVSQPETVHGPEATFFKDDPLRVIAVSNDVPPLGRGCGRNIIATEALTSRMQNWERAPSALKSGIDWSLCAGNNKTVFHLYAIQPDTNRKPGYMEHGTGVNRNLTWWPQAHAWFSYITRCQFMLRQGVHVSDVCFAENNFEAFRDRIFQEEFPAKFRYDVCPWEDLIERMSAKDGLAVLPEGQAYRLIVLPNRGDIHVAALRKLKELVAQGVAVLGPRPIRARGLADYPRCDAEVQALANELWGDQPGARGEHAFGKGKVFWGMTPVEALAALGVPRDFHCAPGSPASPGMDWIHRRTPDADIYFVVNRADHEVTTDAFFRITGKTPELWDPDSAIITRPLIHEEQNGMTRVPLTLEPYGSLFVVFRKTSAPAAQPQFVSSEPVLSITGPWQVRFLNGMGAPAQTTFEQLQSWTGHADPNIKWYSGSAVYSCDFPIPENLLATKPRLLLDLGDVRELADVKLNGRTLATLWKPNYRVEITAAAKSGVNHLEITVANTWLNRFVGDLGLPPNQRVTSMGIACSAYTKDTPLRPSGLLGPVTLRTMAEMTGKP